MSTSRPVEPLLATQSINPVHSSTGIAAEQAKIAYSRQARQPLPHNGLTQGSDVSITAGEQSLLLLLHTTLDRINDVLTPEMGSIHLHPEPDSEATPGAVASQIIRLTTRLYPVYAERHIGPPPYRQAERFMTLVRNGLDQGFDEARDILRRLQVLQDAVEKDLHACYQQIQLGFEKFLAGKAKT